MPTIITAAGAAAGDDSNGSDDDETAVGDGGEKCDERDTMLDAALLLSSRAVGRLGRLLRKSNSRESRYEDLICCTSSHL